jgi:hypothetical protein
MHADGGRALDRGCAIFLKPLRGSDRSLACIVRSPACEPSWTGHPDFVIATRGYDLLRRCSAVEVLDLFHAQPLLRVPIGIIV